MSTRIDLFRPEAVGHHAASTTGDGFGDPLRFDRRWTRVAYAIVVAAAIAGFLFASLFSVNEYAAGPAVIRIDGRRMITATAPATVETVEVNPGQLVEQGTVLARMHVAEETRELERAGHELDLQVARMLLAPGDPAMKSTIGVLREARDRAQNAVWGRTIRADVAGAVTDVRVRPGQHVNAGEVLLAVRARGETHASLVAMIGADYRPMLRAGLGMRFELDGFRYEYADLHVDEVSAEAVGPMEIQRFLGGERADTVPLAPGAMVLVTARLPAATFSSDGRPYGYFDGLTGKAEIRVRSEPILLTLIPALRHWLPIDRIGAATARQGWGR